MARSLMSFVARAAISSHHAATPTAGAHRRFRSSLMIRASSKRTANRSTASTSALLRWGSNAARRSRASRGSAQIQPTRRCSLLWVSRWGRNFCRCIARHTRAASLDALERFHVGQVLLATRCSLVIEQCRSPDDGDLAPFEVEALSVGHGFIECDAVGAVQDVDA